jgi:hypothetical protein
MKDLTNYKNRFFNLLESELGDVKPLLNEESSFESQFILKSAKEMASQEGVGEDVTEYVDNENPTCVPTTGDQEKDGIISKIWEWANNPANRSNLKTTLKSLKDAIFKAKEEKKEEVTEQTAAALLTIGGVALTPSILIAIGGILLIIIIVAIISKSGKRKSSCKRRSKLFKRHGIDGMFM